MASKERLQLIRMKGDLLCAPKHFWSESTVCAIRMFALPELGQQVTSSQHTRSSLIFLLVNQSPFAQEESCFFCIFWFPQIALTIWPHNPLGASDLTKMKNQK